MNCKWLVGAIGLLGTVLALAAHAAEKVPLPESSYALPNNFYGAHLLVGDGADGTKGDKHLRWARFLVGRWGYAKTLLADIDKNTKQPPQGWIDYVNKCYQLELIPVLRLGGHYGGGGWRKPEADSPGDYTSIAQAVKRVVAGLPRTDMCPLYIEVWNEPNLAVEWSGKANPQEYADFFVAVAKAIRSIGDPRIKILNGGLATSPEWAEALCKANTEFISSFDLWSCHPYPMNRPPHLNHHNKNIKPDSELSIDSYLLELAKLRECGRDNVKIMITETGWDLGNAVYTKSEGHPIIDEYNRADYAMRAFRDYYPNWPELVAVFPFEFSNEGWQQFDYVYPESGINPDGSPTKPHYQYTVVAALAKPTDTTGAISGTVTVAGLDVRLDGAEVSIGGKPFTSDPMGNYFFGRLEPGSYSLSISKPGFKALKQKVQVAAAKNSVVDVALEATLKTTLSGVVRSGDDDKPVAGAVITLQPGKHEARTDSDGRYILENVIPARYKLSATAQGRYKYEAADVRISSEQENRHDLRLGQLAKLPPGENMLNNASMEAGGGGGGKEWIALGFETLKVDGDVMRSNPGGVADKTAHTGRLSQSMRVSPKETVIRQITHYNTARVGTKYFAGIWIKTDCPDDQGAAWITFDATDNSGGVVGRLGPSRKVTGRSEWTWVSLEGPAPKGSERLSLNLHTQGKSGVAYFDDAFVGVVTPAR
ncbi:MAG TPA: carboxypeptidase regulatory-like domain-containing protein [Phycisphaerae bacterium]|nr:carboxypeptidase regulatory-like domain-containing protein [Phycisphaerae bacterium]HRR83902.1 carboxypeptidase regulatory-like domain-containing protein [Phycisphaerae bacterium]